MAATFQLQLVTPEHILVDEQVTTVEIPGRGGHFGVLAGHAPLLSALDPGILTIESGGPEREFFVDGGFVEVYDNHVRVLADHAQRKQDVQVGDSEERLKEGNEALRKARTPHDVDVAMTIVKKARARLDIAGPHPEQ